MDICFPDGMDRDRFLEEYWQKKPLLFRNALRATAFPLSPNELAGLACDEEVESRVVIQHGPETWELLHGPFHEDAFANLPKKRWSLLVQDADKCLPDVAALIDAFDFVPSWRIDDIMVSFATDGGGVGPHTDAYDVFLMQGRGRRRWRISDQRYHERDLIPGLELRILKHFDTTEDWVLEPGDMLYLPPGTGHWGVAEGECMTYSLGFRAPNQKEIAADWFQHLVAQAGEQHLRDPEDLGHHHLAELTEGTFTAAAGILEGLPATGSQEFRCWLGRYLTEPKPHLQIEPPKRTVEPSDVAAYINEDGILVRHPWARLSWAHLDIATIALFYNGDFLTLPPHRAEEADVLCRKTPLPQPLLRSLAGDPVMLEALAHLMNCGILEAGPAT